MLAFRYEARPSVVDNDVEPQQSFFEIASEWFHVHEVDVPESLLENLGDMNIGSNFWRAGSNQQKRSLEEIRVVYMVRRDDLAIQSLLKNE